MGSPAGLRLEGQDDIRAGEANPKLYQFPENHQREHLERSQRGEAEVRPELRAHFENEVEKDSGFLLGCLPGVSERDTQGDPRGDFEGESKWAPFRGTVRYPSARGEGRGEREGIGQATANEKKNTVEC